MYSRTRKRSLSHIGVLVVALHANVKTMTSPPPSNSITNYSNQRHCQPHPIAYLLLPTTLIYEIHKLNVQ